MERTLKEGITDKFLLLCLIQCSNGIGATKLQKYAYLTEAELSKQGIKSLNFNFIKMPYGPYSNELKEDTSALVKLNAITPYAHRPTFYGITILKNFRHLLTNNPQIMRIINSVCAKYSSIERDALVKLVHEMNNPIRPSLSIHDTPHGYYLLKRLDYWNDEFKISKSDQAALEIYFDTTKFRSLRKSIADAKNCSAVNLRDVPEFA